MVVVGVKFCGRFAEWERAENSNKRLRLLAGSKTMSHGPDAGWGRNGRWEDIQGKVLTRVLRA